VLFTNIRIWPHTARVCVAVGDPQTKIQSAPARAEDPGQHVSVDRSRYAWRRYSSANGRVSTDQQDLDSVLNAATSVFSKAQILETSILKIPIRHPTR